MTTQASLKRLLQRRTTSIDAVELRPLDRFRVRVFIQPKEGVAFDDAKADVLRVLHDEGSISVLYDVVALDSTVTPLEYVPASVHIASFASDQTRDGLRRTLVHAVPTLGRAVFEEKRGESVRILVAHEDGTSSPALVERVRSTLASVGFAGLPFAVEPLPPNYRRNDLANAGFVLPRRDADIVELTEEDEETYAARIHRLLDGKVDAVGLVDKHVGSRVLATAALRPPLPLTCLLPFYDRVFVEMPSWDRSEVDYFQHHFGTSEADFLAYCQRDRVIPIFKFNLGTYPRKIVEPWLNNYALPFLSPRTFDYIALRHVWQTSPYLRMIRDDRELAAILSDFVRRTMVAGGASDEARGMAQLFSWLLHGSEFFEGVAWHRGHLALGNLSSGGPLGHLIAAMPNRFRDRATADTLAIETFGAITSIATAQAFDASLTEGMVLNESVLQLVLPFFKDAGPVLSTAQTSQLKTLIDSLELSYSGRIPAAEYLDVLDLAETRRIRELVHKLLGEGDERAQSLELRERVRALNNEVTKIEKNAIETAGVDVVGDLAKAGAAAGGTTLGFKFVADFLQLPLMKRVGGMLFEKAIDDTKAGDALDKLRGAINGVSPEAIRIYRIRKKLSK